MFYGLYGSCSRYLSTSLLFLVQEVFLYPKTFYRVWQHILFTNLRTDYCHLQNTSGTHFQNDLRYSSHILLKKIKNSHGAKSGKQDGWWSLRFVNEKRMSIVMVKETEDLESEVQGAFNEELCIARGARLCCLSLFIKLMVNNLFVKGRNERSRDIRVFSVMVTFLFSLPNVLVLVRTESTKFHRKTCKWDERSGEMLSCRWFCSSVKLSEPSSGKFFSFLNFQSWPFLFLPVPCLSSPCLNSAHMW